MNVLKTKFKEKIPKGYSYPIGVEKLSEALLDVIGDNECEIWFSVKDEFWSSSFHQRIKNKDPIKVIEIRYSTPQTHHSSSQKMIDSGGYDPKWQIRVNSVPTEYVSSVKNLLITEINCAAKWLSQTDLKHKIWQRYYDPKSDKLVQNI